jgi:hypothetical protein
MKRKHIVILVFPDPDWRDKDRVSAITTVVFGDPASGAVYRVTRSGGGRGCLTFDRVEVMSRAELQTAWDSAAPLGDRVVAHRGARVWPGNELPEPWGADVVRDVSGDLRSATPALRAGGIHPRGFRDGWRGPVAVPPYFARVPYVARPA